MSAVVEVEREVMWVRPVAIGEQVLDAVAHLAGEQLVAFLRLLAAGDVEEDAEHGPADDALILALAARRDPADLAAEHDAEVGFVAPRTPRVARRRRGPGRGRRDGCGRRAPRS
jgi:hypothetical protein